jgi:hypothetical protein
MKHSISHIVAKVFYNMHAIFAVGTESNTYADKNTSKMLKGFSTVHRED